MKKSIRHLIAYLDEHHGLTLAMSFVVALAYMGVVQVVVYNLIMPIFGAFSESRSWRSLVLKIGRVEFGIGEAVAEFFILLFVLWGLMAVVGIRSEVIRDRDTQDDDRD